MKEIPFSVLTSGSVDTVFRVPCRCMFVRKIKKMSFIFERLYLSRTTPLVTVVHSTKDPPIAI